MVGIPTKDLLVKIKEFKVEIIFKLTFDHNKK